jgi:hypothetical protein
MRHICKMKQGGGGGKDTGVVLLGCSFHFQFNKRLQKHVLSISEIPVMLLAEFVHFLSFNITPSIFSS